MKNQIDLGVLYSRSGTYAALSQALWQGTMDAIETVNAAPDSAITFRPIERDPGGEVQRYAPLCAEILAQSDAQHVIGCVTSWSRKEVIPALDRAGATLWYNVPYEGFETSARVVYSHACTNQNILPVLAWAQREFGNAAFLTGSNYIWGWETCRFARHQVEATGGQILGERYLPLGDEDVAGLISEIEATRPRFILNSLVGASSYAFIRAYRALGMRNAHFRPETCPLLSCNLTEAELPVLGEAAEGLISVGPSFCHTAQASGRGSSLELTAYNSVLTLAAMLSDMKAGQDAQGFDAFIANHGNGYGIDPATHHRTLDVKIAQVRRGAFDVLAEWHDVRPDPYMTRPARHPQLDGPRLSVVRA
ncbi:amino acid/amide ABC transporter substrate-binding protein, HAAT family [Jannaschia faecimaris]|uniref:Amino acid/amide ABC transporter substrate-binding protein, HAAT family n=1 Tax=Jannaschia faecimaris TaxID=1244108 RepID=A0A1H3TJS0_9RHOB|nr:transporter substrate-binding protein [Jannaschia faecimaris]SDZ50227.1 amino acid/amide ABC transporter substrate-binding protein, HAAT family [Jannaschia faecimaris]